MVILSLTTGAAFAATEHAPTPTRTTTAPDAMQGVWSSPDCADSQKAWIISAHYFIHADDTSLFVDRITAWHKDDNNGDTLYAFRATNTPDGLLNRTNDGLMKMIRGDIDTTKPLTQSWGWTQDEIGEEYSRCVKLFDTTPQMGQDEVNSIFLLDRALESCGTIEPQKFSGASGAACRKDLFKLADTNRDQTLDRAEINTAERQILFLNRGIAAQPHDIECPRSTPDDGNVQKITDAAQNVPQTQSLATILLPPGVDSVDLKSILAAGIADPALWRHAGDLSRLLPFLPAPPCPVTAPAPVETIKTGEPVLPASPAVAPKALIRP